MAAPIQVDFNDADTPGAGWNTVDLLNVALSLNDTNGDPTAITVTITGDFNNGSGNTGSASASLSDPSLEPGARDYFWIAGEDDDGFVTLDGLDPSKTYIVEVVASRSA